MAGVDRAVEMGVAHPDSLAITGSSYGGYLTAMTVAKTDRFEAASMFLGITNLVSYAGTGSLSGILAAYMGGEVWERYDTYEENSPIYRVDQVSTPTQVLHLAPDPVHPPGQSQAFSRALKGRGVPTQRVVYPSLSPKHTRSVTPRTLDWFDDHLGRFSGASEAASAGQ
jgi:dipeptidyl aminopeptidase/acylaminoacyl peptidase